MSIIPSNSSVSVAQVASIVEWTTPPYNMGGMYRGGSYVSSLSGSGIPTAGAISLGQFRNVTISGKPYIWMDADTLTVGASVTSWQCKGSWGGTFQGRSNTTAQTAPVVVQLAANNSQVVKAVKLNTTLISHQFLFAQDPMRFDTFQTVVAGSTVYEGATVVLVGKLSRITSQEFFFDARRSAGTVGRGTLSVGQYGLSTEMLILLQSYSGTADSNPLVGGSGGVMGGATKNVNLNVMAWRFNNSAPGTTKTAQFFRNSTTVVNSSNSISPHAAMFNLDIGTTPGTNCAVIGAQVPNLNALQFANAHICEFQVYKRRLSDSDLGAVISGLVTKWKI